MLTKYLVRLTDEERQDTLEVIGKLKGPSQKVRRAQILLKADADDPGWTDQRIINALSTYFDVGGRRSRKSGNDSSSQDFGKRLMGKSVRSHPPKNCSMVNKKQRSLRHDWDRRRKVVLTGLCGCWLAKSWSWKSSTR